MCHLSEMLIVYIFRCGSALHVDFKHASSSFFVRNRDIDDFIYASSSKYCRVNKIRAIRTGNNKDAVFPTIIHLRKKFINLSGFA